MSNSGKTRYDYYPSRAVQKIIERSQESDPDLNLQAHIDRFILWGEWARNLTDIQPPRFLGRNRNSWVVGSGISPAKKA